ncbi:MAG TPA: nuclear transport factor 2 family protein [Chitinophagaceae bacterium]
MKKAPTIYFLLTILLSCTSSESSNENKPNNENAKQEIEKAEEDFAQMAADKGIAEAFYFFADSAATIKRQNDTLIHGKEAIKIFYSTPFYQKATVKWSPDFVQASENGDMGYTYGKYVWSSTDSTGKPITFNGVFHTVWKKQPDGSWKYVWD